MAYSSPKNNNDIGVLASVKEGLNRDIKAANRELSEANAEAEKYSGSLTLLSRARSENASLAAQIEHAEAEIARLEGVDQAALRARRDAMREEQAMLKEANGMSKETVNSIQESLKKVKKPSLRSGMVSRLRRRIKKAAIIAAAAAAIGLSFAGSRIQFYGSNTTSPAIVPANGKAMTVHVDDAHTFTYVNFPNLPGYTLKFLVSPEVNADSKQAGASVNVWNTKGSHLLGMYMSTSAETTFSGDPRLARYQISSLSVTEPSYGGPNSVHTSFTIKPLFEEAMTRIPAFTITPKDENIFGFGIIAFELSTLSRFLRTISEEMGQMWKDAKEEVNKELSTKSKKRKPVHKD